MNPVEVEVSNCESNEYQHDGGQRSTRDSRSPEILLNFSVRDFWRERLEEPTPERVQAGLASAERLEVRATIGTLEKVVELCGHAPVFQYGKKTQLVSERYPRQKDGVVTPSALIAGLDAKPFGDVQLFVRRPDRLFRGSSTVEQRAVVFRPEKGGA